MKRHEQAVASHLVPSVESPMVCSRIAQPQNARIR
jgi:hypothetical protein